VQVLQVDEVRLICYAIHCLLSEVHLGENIFLLSCFSYVDCFHYFRTMNPKQPYNQIQHSLWWFIVKTPKTTPFPKSKHFLKKFGTNNIHIQTQQQNFLTQKRNIWTIIFFLCVQGVNIWTQKFMGERLIIEKKLNIKRIRVPLFRGCFLNIMGIRL
jgi:hypothetical protein